MIKKLAILILIILMLKNNFEQSLYFYKKKIKEIEQIILENKNLNDFIYY